ncbi:MAG: hypothetical protein E6K81_14075 [Candidatus Eisenbacteria bacterium]|uniref:Uncharacterized protein n=1 Tax=Eiseniibacteriota bacterium TaxID=2212470 RepID=A0A538U1K4_UNCEI|nr:MAG: hypothetical protein E6K81_14075 [Candidatus Eisenbacteria bacterium]
MPVLDTDANESGPRAVVKHGSESQILILDVARCAQGLPEVEPRPGRPTFNRHGPPLPQEVLHLEVRDCLAMPGRSDVGDAQQVTPATTDPYSYQQRP